MRWTVTAIRDRIHSESDAYLFMEELRWKGATPSCPHCSDGDTVYITPANGTSRKTRTGAMSERRVWRCRACRKQFSVLTDSVFHGTKVPLRTWVLVFFEMCASKNGVAAREIERKYGVCARTAWYMMHRLREAMANDPLAQSLQGVVIADETFIGGDERNKHAKNRKGVGGGPHHKVAVLTLIEKHSGVSRSQVVPDVTGATLAKAIQEQVDAPGSLLYTDDHAAYGPVGRQFLRHETVAHSTGVYVGDKGATTNHAEGFFSQLKRSIDGTHHHVSRTHLHRYLAEFDYRYSTRTMTDTQRMSALMERVGGRRLTYERVTDH